MLRYLLDCPVRRLHQICKWRFVFKLYSCADKCLGPEPGLFRAFQKAPPSPPDIINMPPFTVAFIAAAAAGTALYRFFSGGGDDDKRSNGSSPSPLPTTSTPSRPYPPDSYSRDQTNTRTPVTSASHHGLHHSSRSPTYAGDSQRASSTSTQAQPSYPQPSSSTLAAEVEAGTRALNEARATWVKANANIRAAEASLASRDDSRQAHRSDPVSRFNEESRGTLGTSAHTHGSQPLQTRIGQTKDSTTTTAGHGTSVHRTGLASHRIGGSSQTPSTSTHEQASYHQLPANSRAAAATAKTQTRHLTSDHDGWYRPSVASPYTGEFVTSAHTYVPQPPQVTSTRVGRITVSTATMTDHTRGIHGAGLASHYVGESGQTPTSTRAEASYLQSPTRSGSRAAQTTVKTNPTVPDYDDYGYWPSVTSANARESRETFSTSTRAHVPQPPQVTSTRVSQSTVSTTATADYPHGGRRPRLAAPYSAESTLTGPATSPTRASYLRTPSPDDIIGYTDFFPTHSRTHSSSSGASSSTRVALRSPSPQPDVLYGTESEAAENTQDMKYAGELRKRARRCNIEMRNARDLAKSARKSGDRAAEQMYKQDAIALESEMKSLNKRAAKVIFEEKNKVRGSPLRSGCYAQPCHARPIKREQSTSTAFMSWKLSSTQRKNSTLPCIGMTTRSVSSLVRLSTRP